MTVTDDARRQAEMERGRQMAERNVRAVRIGRLGRAPGVKVNFLDGLQTWFVDGVEIAAVDVDDPNYPTDALFAKIALALMATGHGLDNVPLPPITHRGPSEEAQEYKRDMQRRNASREDFK